MARDFDGVDDEVDCGNDSSLNPSSGLAMSVWLKTSDGTSNAGIIEKWQSSGYMLFFTSTTGTLRFQIGGGTLTGSTVVNDGNLHHILATTNGTTGRIYIDGTEDVNGSLALTSSTTTEVLSIGGQLPTTNFLDAMIAEVCLWDDNLTADEASALANGVNPIRIKRNSIMGYWPIYGIASPEPDLSGNGNNGTVTGTTAADHPPVGRYAPAPRYGFPFVSSGPPAATTFTQAVVIG
jgi:hypothetical protein